MLSGVLIFLITLTALLAIPLSVSFKLSWRQALISQITVSWLYGLIRLHFSPSEKHPPYKNIATWSRRSEGNKPHSDNKATLITRLQKKALRRRILRYMQDCWQAIRKDNFTIHGRVGLGDPADTGQLWAVMGPVTAILQNLESASIRIEPDFIDSTIEFDSSGDIRLMPLQLLYLTIGLFLSPAIWREIIFMRKTTA